MIDNLAAQLNSLRKECESDLEGTLKNLKGMGFRGVEFSGYFGRTPEEIREALNNSGLELAASHVPIEDLLDEFEDVIDYHRRLGGEKLVIYFGDIHGSESLSLLIDNLNGLNCRLNQYKIDLYYHNHSQEFKNYGTSSIALDEIMDRTDLLLEFDAFWAKQAGVDVIEVMNRFSDRIGLVHLRDGENDRPCVIGKSDMDCKSIFELSKKNNVEWLIIEVSNGEHDALKAMEESISFIKNNY